MTASLLEIDGLCVRIDDHPVIDGVGFSIAPKETFALLGESGSGKSMIALSILRLLPESAHFSAGRIGWRGENLLELPESAVRRLRGGEIAMIFQEPMTSLNPVLTLGLQIGETLVRHRGLRGKALRDEAAALLQAVGIADARQRLDDYPFRLSGGMKQRAMIAMALAGNPQLLIADEPTTALDVTVQAQVLALLRAEQQQRGMGMLLITHDLGVAAAVADRVGVLYAGELVEIAPRDVFFSAARHPYSRKLFAALPDRRLPRLVQIPGSVPLLGERISGCRFAARCDLVSARCRIEPPPWVTLSGGHAVRCHEHARTAQAEATPLLAASGPALRRAHPLLEIRGLQVHFRQPSAGWGKPRRWLRAVDGVDLSLQPAETLALVGESGCGKTTLGRVVAGLQEPTAGEVVLHQTEGAGPVPHRPGRGRSGVQMVFQDPFSSLNPRMRIDRLIEEGMVALKVETEVSRQREKLVALMRQVGLPQDALERYPHEFSGGQRQRIAIARALAVAPRLIVCDEPTSALDVSVQAQVVNLLRDIQRDSGVALLFITHNLALAGYFAHRVAVMYLGGLVETGASADVLERPLHPYTAALLDAVPEIGRPLRLSLAGEAASAVEPPSGCPFHPRCPQARPLCEATSPVASQHAAEHWVWCHFPLNAKSG